MAKQDRKLKRKKSSTTTASPATLATAAQNLPDNSPRPWTTESGERHIGIAADIVVRLQDAIEHCALPALMDEFFSRTEVIGDGPSARPLRQLVTNLLKRYRARPQEMEAEKIAQLPQREIDQWFEEILRILSPLAGRALCPGIY